MTDIVQVLVSGLVSGSVIALVASGYDLVFASTRIINFAQGSMLMVAGYLAFVLVRAGAPIWAAFLVTVALSVVIGVVVEVIAVRPLGRFDPATNVAWVITTFGVSLMAVDLVRATIGAEPHRVPALVHSVLGWQASRPAGVAVTATDVVIVVAAVAIVVALRAIETRTWLGRAFRAVSDDRQSAALVGIDPELVVVTTFALAGALAAVGAVVLASRTDVRLDTGVALGVQAFVAAVLGGLGSARGALVGGYGIGFTLAIAATISSQGAQWGPIAVFVLFLTVLAIRPAGLLGSVEVERA